MHAFMRLCVYEGGLFSVTSERRSLPDMHAGCTHRTGMLVVHMPYDAVRGYFVEALLVISIIVITRISLPEMLPTVRNFKL
jgi:hypothetical protein